MIVLGKFVFGALTLLVVKMSSSSDDKLVIINSIIKKHPYLDYISCIPRRNKIINSNLGNIQEEKEEEEFNDWTQSRNQRKKTKAKKTNKKRPYIPSLYCESRFDTKTIKNILNSYCKNIVSNIKIINRNSYIIFLNTEKEFNVNSCEFNLIRNFNFI